MPTAEQIAASKEAQILEAGERQQPMDDLGNRAPDPRTDQINDTAGPPEDAPPRGNSNDEGDTQGGPRGRPKPIYMSPSDEMRANIAKRFKRDDEGRVPYNGDPNDPEMQYGKLGRAPEADPEPEPQPQPAPQPEQRQPRMITQKVRGKDVTKSEDEWLADAAKVSAADSYLEEGRQLLETARAIRKDNGERAPTDSHRPEDRNNTQDGRTDPSLSADPQHPGDELEGAIEEVRYGTDSKEAAQKLRQVITKEADKAADNRQLQRLIGNDNAKSTKAMKAFIEANPDLANDQIAAQVMEQQIYSIQREELLAMGVDESKLPKNNQDLARMHQEQRIYGHPVSAQDEMLSKAKDRFVRWKGGNPSQPQPQPRKESPRVEVNVNRDARRAAIPNQPTRSTAPPPAQPRQNDSGQPRSRSDVISNMRRSRGQIVA